ncbi:helix-turn-helix domain-containing protein [Salisediminibacterium halotolerans]|uniref:Uncharacterized protein YpbB n=1 Tax=Salisediminibacterium halotolerans TaxID=517425 RepID=A0A1H9P694_9BACI|nr:helix-turn-helix domain-containing protein [Salisediminibacterium haloalkalitolerans]SER43756.1 Uncharacterized protein YpbB [Salisediminibacterium haloalkalitolerans]
MKSAERLLLAAIQSAGAERSLNGVKHILKGKRSAQTIQDVRFFQCERITASLKDAPEVNIESIVSALKERGCIRSGPADTHHLTAEGVRYLQELEDDVPFPATYHGMPYEWHSAANGFWQRLRLLIQTLGNLQYDIRFFQPVSYDYTVQRDVKTVLNHSSYSKDQQSRQLYQEVESVLTRFSDQEAEIFVRRLTSAFSAGKTYTQLAAEKGKDELYIHFLHRGIIHEMIQLSAKESESFPLLKRLVPAIPNQTSVTETAAKTHEYIKAGKMLREIAATRGLKLSTIEDHVVEIALHDDAFDPADYITNEVITMAANKAADLGTSRLKTIKENLPDGITYFQIRLALAIKSGRS